MIGIKYFSILIFVKLAVALSADGFCSFVETYTETVTITKTVKVRVPFSKKCGIFSTRICYEYRDQIKYEGVTENVPRTKIARRCCQGYIPENGRCIPVCSDDCLNGLCTEPDICTCSKGFHKNDKDICVENECDPTISQSDQCVEGTCTVYGTCMCNEGYGKSDSNVGPSVESKCVPKCSDGCLNGNCESPETCICNSGYATYNSSVCNPICHKDCIFGDCLEPDKCSCFEGYRIRNGSDHICDPYCKNSCLGGKCDKPDKCLCDQGYELSHENQICEPICDKECINSNCTAPNVCSCEPGFSTVNSTHCQILCENCIHGYCEQPNECQCNIGYHMDIGDNKICVQDECTNDVMEENSCENGYCSDGLCECDSGYEKSVKKDCSPICSLECVNGYCSKPEVCECHSGYDFITTNSIDDDGNCTNCTSITQWNVCMCITDCENGISDAITFTMSLFGIVVIIIAIIIMAGVLAYWRYKIGKRNSYICAVADVAYRKDKDGISL